MNTILYCALLSIIIFALVVFNKFAEKLKNTHFLFAFAGIILLGLVLRTVVIIFVPCTPISDYEAMFSAARSFAAGGNPFTMGSYFQRFPHITTFPVVCGLLMKIFGDSVWVVKIFNVIFKTVAIFAAGLIGKELYGKKGMLSAAFLYAIFPPDIFYTPVVATENFALAFLVFSLLFYIRAYKSENIKNTIKNAVFCGLILSAGCLLRGVAPFYFAAYFAGIVLLFKGYKRKLTALMALLISYIIVFQAVSLSLFYSGTTEYKLSDKGEPYVVYMLVGSNFETNGMYSAEDHGIYLDAGEDPELASKMATDKLIERISQNKEKIIPLLIKKTVIIWMEPAFNSVFWSMYENGEELNNPYAPTAMLICATIHLLLLILTVIALIFYKDRLISFMLILMPLAFEGGLMLMEIQPRYTYSIAYIFVIFAAIGSCALWDYINKKRRREKSL